MRQLFVATGLALTSSVDGLLPFSARPRGSVEARFAPSAPAEPVPHPADAFGKVASEAGGVAEMFAELPPTVGAVASKSAVVAGALTSLWLTPGPALVSWLGAAVGGGLVRFTLAPQLVEGRYKSMQTKVAALLRDMEESGEPWQETPPETVRGIVESWGLPEAYSKAALCHVYTRFVLEVMQSAKASTSELADLAALRRVLSLDAESVGNAFYDVGLELYREVQWALEEEDEEDEAAFDSTEQRKVSKLLFVCDRALGSEPAETRAYELGRLRKVLHLKSVDGCAKRVASVASPFYERALVGTVANLASVEASMLAKTRAKLGITEEAATKMHSEVYAAEVAKLVREQGGDDDDEDAALSLDEASFARLEKLAAVLELGDEAQVVLDSETVPVFSADVKAACAAAFDDEDAAAAIAAIAARRGELRLGAGAADAVVAEQCRARLDEIYTAADEAVDSRNSAEALFFAGDLARTHAVAKALMEGTLVAGDAAFIEKTLYGHPKATTLAAQLYQAYVDDTIGQGRLEPDRAAELDTLKKMLDVPEASASRMHNRAAKKALNALVQPALASGDLDSAKLAAFREEIRYEEDAFRAEALDIWQSKLKQFSAENPLLSEQRTKDLDALRSYLGLAEADVADAVEEICGPVYTKSVLEAMAASGASIIVEEYVDGLEKLRVRLGLSEAMAAQAFDDATLTQISKLVQQIDDSLKQSKSSSYELALPRGLDTFMNDCCTLSDFVVRNRDIATQNQDGSWSYAVTAEDLVDAEHATQLYSEFVRRALNAAQSQTSSRVARFFDAMPHVAGALGMPLDDAERTKDSIVDDFYTRQRKNPEAEYNALLERLSSVSA